MVAGSQIAIRKSPALAAGSLLLVADMLYYVGNWWGSMVAGYEKVAGYTCFTSTKVLAVLVQKDKY